MSSNNNITSIAPPSVAAAPPPPGATAAAVVNRKRPAPISTAPLDDEFLGGTTTTATTTTDAEVAAIAAHAAHTAHTAAATATGGQGGATPPSKKSVGDNIHRPIMSRSPTTPPGSAGSASASASSTTTNKPYKGLRHFSMMVCKKVEEKGTTTYNEVADELVQHVISERRKEQQMQQQQQQDSSYSTIGMGGGGSGSGSGMLLGGGSKESSSKFDEKNIRRRVYDALNVLMAMDIICKDKKAISWKGLPTTAHQDLDMLARERDYRLAEIQRKREALRELLVQQVCFRNLVAYNHQRRSSEKAADTTTDTAANASAASAADHKIPLPFIIVNTHSTAVIQCNMSRDLTDVMFDFSQPFEINDDNTILKRLGMDKIARSPALVEMLPDELLQYAEQHNLLTSILLPEDTTSTSTPVAPITTTAATVTTGGTATAAASASADYHSPAFM